MAFSVIGSKDLAEIVATDPVDGGFLNSVRVADLGVRLRGQLRFKLVRGFNSSASRYVAGK